MLRTVGDTSLTALGVSATTRLPGHKYSRQEGPRFKSQLRVFLHGVCMFSSSMRLSVCMVVCPVMDW
ncbi:hypothetical protein ATANTOWER_017330 [Ataeniobius toweri]|uniref:Uncharacterized protein n=1 Tax=Ataeniobius toweri TaxID=208326 RepID=A0ABU7AB94_9TELE|nr:hypothetical protein [Ataeniobius toweri]